MLPEAIDAMTEELARLGNPSSLHNAGRRARRVVEESRERIAEVFGARASEVIFTSGGTEADNLAVKGLFWARRTADGRRTRLLSTAVEHHAVLDSVRWLADTEGACADWLCVDGIGAVTPSVLRSALERDPDSAAMVSVMWANNEVGTIQPIALLAEVAHEFGVPFHTDAVQAAGQLSVDFGACGADALTVTGHKIGGPVGAGALIVGRGVNLVPVLHGGGQERDIRSGTLDAPAIRAFAVAAEITARRRARDRCRLAALRDDLIRQVLAGCPGRGPERPAARPGPAARQRALLLPRLRGRRPAAAAGRARHRLLDRLGVHGGRGRAKPRAARHGRRRGPRPRLTALLPRPHHHPGRHRRPGRLHRRSGQPAPAAPPPAKAGLRHRLAG